MKAFYALCVSLQLYFAEKLKFFNWLSILLNVLQFWKIVMMYFRVSLITSNNYLKILNFKH